LWIYFFSLYFIASSPFFFDFHFSSGFPFDSATTLQRAGKPPAVPAVAKAEGPSVYVTVREMISRGAGIKENTHAGG